jgi:hypothetical protein
MIDAAEQATNVVLVVDAAFWTALLSLLTAIVTAFGRPIMQRVSPEKDTAADTVNTIASRTVDALSDSLKAVASLSGDVSAMRASLDTALKQTDETRRKKG